MNDMSKNGFKFIVIGSSGVGKTSILRRLVDGVFEHSSQSTVGVEFYSTIMSIDQTKIRLEIWDTAGQEKFRSITKSYYRSALGVILVFDLTVRRTFDELHQWLTDIHSLCDPNAIVTLIGNKVDLHEARVVSLSEIESFCQLHQVEYFETSAVEGDNIHEAFHRTTSLVFHEHEQSRSTECVDIQVPDTGGCFC